MRYATAKMFGTFIGLGSRGTDGSKIMNEPPKSCNQAYTHTHCNNMPSSAMMIVVGKGETSGPLNQFPVPPFNFQQIICIEWEPVLAGGSSSDNKFTLGKRELFAGPAHGYVQQN